MEASEFFDRGFPPFSYNKPHGAVMAGRFFETGFLQIGHQPSHMASLFGHSAADAMGGVSRSATGLPAGRSVMHGFTWRAAQQQQQQQQHQLQQLQRPRPALQLLPRELWYHIILYLDVPGLVSVASVSHDFAALVRLESVWAQLASSPRHHVTQMVDYYIQQRNRRPLRLPANHDRFWYEMMRLNYMDEHRWLQPLVLPVAIPAPVPAPVPAIASSSSAAGSSSPAGSSSQPMLIDGNGDDQWEDVDEEMDNADEDVDDDDDGDKTDDDEDDGDGNRNVPPRMVIPQQPQPQPQPQPPQPPQPAAIAHPILRTQNLNVKGTTLTRGCYCIATGGDHMPFIYVGTDNGKVIRLGHENLEVFSSTRLHQGRPVAQIIVEEWSGKLISACMDGTINMADVYSLEDSEMVDYTNVISVGENNAILCFEVMPAFFLVGTNTGLIIIVHRLSKQMRSIQSDHGKVTGIRYVGGAVLTTGSDGAVRIWHWENNDMLVLTNAFQAHDGVISALDVWGHHLATTGCDDRVRVWHWVSRALVAEFAHSHYAYGVHLDKTRLLTSSHDGFVVMRNWRTRETLFALRLADDTVDDCILSHGKVYAVRSSGRVVAISSEVRRPPVRVSPLSALF